MKFEISQQDYDFALEIKQKYNLNDHQSIKIEEWIFLYKIIIENNYKSILEIGSYHYFSSVAILEAIAHNGFLLSLDIKFQIPNWHHPNTNWIKLEQSSHDILPKLKNKFDLILIDGDHSTQAVKLDIRNSLNLINENGTILMHDSNYPRTRKGIVEELGEEVEFWSFKPMKFHGFGIWHKKIIE